MMARPYSGALPDAAREVHDETARMNTQAADVFERIGKNTRDLADFESDITIADWTERYRVGDLVLGPVIFAPIAEVSPVHLRAAAHTDTNLIQPSVVITDTTGTPYAGFDMSDTPNRQPAASVHFLPADFGITTPGDYVVRFYVDTTAGVRLTTSVSPGVTVLRANSDSRTGAHTVTFTFVNLAPNQPVFADITQTEGTRWSWYRTTISYPPLVLTPAVLNP